MVVVYYRRLVQTRGGISPSNGWYGWYGWYGGNGVDDVVANLPN